MVRNGLDGRGRTGQRPQRWRRLPPHGAAHSFAGLLSRLVLDEPATCGRCEQHLAAHQGPTVPHGYEYPVIEVALALVRVGRGMFHTEAGQRSRIRTARDAAPTAQLVGNWVEVFAPVVTAAHRPTAWSETIVCDSTAFHANLPRGRTGVAFSVMSAWGYDTQGNGRLLAWQAVGDATNSATWADFFASKTGSPRLLVCDWDKSIIKAATTAFPGTTVRLCRSHLRRNVDAMRCSPHQPAVAVV